MRINKLLSNYGYCSRKEVSKLIEENRIIVNGEFCTQGQWVEEYDHILLDGIEVTQREKIYIALNKPRGVVCTSARDIENNIIDFLNYEDYIFPVGRLDKDSEGLILLTNDGDLADKVLSSENYHEKEYIVTLEKEYDDIFLEKMSSGVEILGTLTRKCNLKRIDSNTFSIILTQGLNRQIRRMSKVLGYNVVSLKRIRIVNLKLDDLSLGEYRHLKKEEVICLSESINNKACYNMFKR